MIHPNHRGETNAASYYVILNIASLHRFADYAWRNLLQFPVA
jgi:hypothetical protein